jgi:hypothetical protein
MKKIELTNKKIGLRATPMALLFYDQAFDSDLIADLSKLQQEHLPKVINGDFSSFNSVNLLKIGWAMNKANNYPGDFPTFEEWVNDLNSEDVTSPKFMMGVVNEATDGFFRRKESGGKPESEQKPRD